MGDFDDHHGLDLDHHYGQTIPPLGFSNNDDHDNHNDEITMIIKGVKYKR